LESKPNADGSFNSIADLLADDIRRRQAAQDAN
jgi:hypothetical protein